MTVETNFVALVLLFQRIGILLLYAGPDQILPLASILGTIIGVLMIGWQRITGFMKSAFHSLRERKRSSATRQARSGENS